MEEPIRPANQTAGEVVGVRRSRRRDRRGRGPRGQAVLPGPLTPAGVPRDVTRRDRFDRFVLDVAEELEKKWADELRLVEFAVEETPLLPPTQPRDWTAAVTVPLASVVPGRDGRRRVVVFRRPIELRVDGSAELGALVFAVVVEQVAELLGRSPEEIDPRYGS